MRLNPCKHAAAAQPGNKANEITYLFQLQNLHETTKSYKTGPRNFKQNTDNYCTSPHKGPVNYCGLKDLNSKKRVQEKSQGQITVHLLSSLMFQTTLFPFPLRLPIVFAGTCSYLWLAASKLALPASSLIPSLKTPLIQVRHCQEQIIIINIIIFSHKNTSVNG